MFSWLSRTVICPYCLGSTSPRRASRACPTCKRKLPTQYTEGYSQQTPFFVQVFGWTGVGKTVFLQAMTLMLVKMGNVWPRYTYAALNDVSQRQVSAIYSQLAQGAMPAPTQLGEQDVYILALRDMVRWGGRTLVTRDCPGEIFDTMNVPLAQAPYLLRAPTTFMLIGPPGDASNAGGRSCDQLLNNYINTLLSRGVNFSREARTLVVVLTKGDQIQNLPWELRKYLVEDPLWAAVNARAGAPVMDDEQMDEYVGNMWFINNRICDWLHGDVAGKNFLRLAERRGIELRFAVISSTGEAASGPALSTRGLSPRRVLDPYFWAMELQTA